MSCTAFEVDLTRWSGTIFAAVAACLIHGISANFVTIAHAGIRGVSGVTVMKSSHSRIYLPSNSALASSTIVIQNIFDLGNNVWNIWVKMLISVVNSVRLAEASDDARSLEKGAGLGPRLVRNAK